MTKEEFIDYHKYLREIFGLHELTPRAMQAWYVGFESMTVPVARRMAELYLHNEPRTPQMPGELKKYAIQAHREINGLENKNTEENQPLNREDAKKFINQCFTILGRDSKKNKQGFTVIRGEGA